MVMWINEIAATWAEYFGWAVIQNSIFLGIIILTLRLLRDTPARIRYWIGMAGLIKLIIPPFLAAPFLKPDPIILSSVGLISIQPVINLTEVPPPPPPTAEEVSETAEAKTAIKGTIRDKESNKLLPGTKVELKGTEFSCVASDKAEFYMMAFPQDRTKFYFHWTTGI
ncbi:hypothetical protein HQ585_08040 [candidate division KSB1 bacterium]|nr:hypothetical protein [candidate division KSB1 bacterium]